MKRQLLVAFFAAPVAAFVPTTSVYGVVTAPHPRPISSLVRLFVRLGMRRPYVSLAVAV